MSKRIKAKVRDCCEYFVGDIDLYQFTIDLNIDDKNHEIEHFVSQSYNKLDREEFENSYGNILKGDLQEAMEAVDTVIQESIEAFKKEDNSFDLEFDIHDEWKPHEDFDVFGRQDGLEVTCEENGETYLKEVDITSIHFGIEITQEDKKLKLQYNVGDNEKHFKKEYFLEQHGESLKELFNEEQVEYITSYVRDSINTHFIFNAPRMTHEEHMLATEYFEMTDIEVNKVKTIKNDDNNYNCIITTNYQNEKYILNLKAEKGTERSAGVYYLDMESLDIDSKDNKAFKEKVLSNFNDDYVANNFEKEDVEYAIKKNLEEGIVEYKAEQKIAKNKSGPCLDIDF